MRSTAYKKKGAPDRWSLTQQKLRLFTCVAPHTKSKGLPIGGPLLSRNLGFLDAYHRIQKARGSQSAVPYSAKTYAFYMRSTAYKKQGAPYRQSLTQQKLMLFTCVASHTKSKGLLIGGPLFSRNLCFLHVYHRVQKARGLLIDAPHIFYYF
jgi:hypothetical protein